MSIQPYFLIVDDFDQMRRVLTSNLKTLGYTNIVQAQNGIDAIKKLRGNNAINIIISDWNMPQLSGLGFLKYIRQDEKYKYIPFIMITAEVGRKHVEAAISSGVTDFLLKPFSLENLSERVNLAMQRKHKLITPAVTPTTALRAQDVVEEISADVQDTAQRLTILAVDDTPDNLTLIVNLFQDEYRVRVAPNGQKALSICNSPDRPNLVLLDIMMPDMDGFEVIRQLKMNDDTSEIPVIFITSLDDPKNVVKGLDAGAVDYVAKPIEPTVLKARVRNFLRYHRGYEELKNTIDAMMDNARLKDDIEQITRHDLKGPLTAIIGVVNQIINEKHAKYNQLKDIEEMSFKLLNMINLSSTLYKIESGTYESNAKPVKIVQLLTKIAGEIDLAFPSKQLKIVIDALADIGVLEPYILGDELLCYSMFHNLVKNSAEASPQEGVVNIAIANEKDIIVSILNVGAVDETIAEQFFDKFVSGKQGGMGLGTYSARLMAEAQGGSINMQTSREANTTTVTVTLPKAQQL